MDTHTPKTEVDATRHEGGCHCGAVRFAVEVDPRQATRCNCTLCTKLGVTGCLVKPEAFTLLAGEDALSCYSWGSEVSRRFFCKRCGVHCFGRGELEFLGGAFVGVSVNCLDALDVEALPLRYWDGRHDNWEAGPRDTPWPVAGSERERDGRGA